jgi:type IV pilus assembly protein PilY1
MVRNVLIPTVLTLVLTLGLSATAEAQSAEPDLRNIRPMITLLVDTSGSMERTVACTCTTPSCRECEPDCSVPDYSSWATLLEAFTGTFDTFSCTETPRSTYVGEYDYNYFLPHFAPPVGVSTQQSNGVLDTYIDRVRFALMTFDGVSTLTSQDTLVPDSSWTAGFETDSQGALGMYSYGGSRLFTFLGCAVDYRLDNGARSEGTGGPYVPGNFIPMGDDTADHLIVNEAIQDALLNTRPFGPTPIAGLLSDYEYMLANHPDAQPVTVPSGPGDSYANCRPQFAIMITDGYPNADMRGAPYYCDAPGYACPYDLPQDTAARLCDFDASAAECTGDIDGLFVVGFNVSDAAAVTALDGIAAAGGTTEALYATDRATLVAALSSAIDAAAPGATSRTVPAFSNSASVSSGNAMYQFSTGFQVAGLTGTEPWSGVIERTRFACCVDAACSGPGTLVVQQDVSAADNDTFHDLLNARVAARNLYTVAPTDGNEDSWVTNDVDADIAASRVPTTAVTAVTGGVTGGAPAEENLDVVRLETSTGGGTLTFNHLDAADLAEADSILDWVHARNTAPAERLANRLGDIYHSSPVLVSAPRVDRTDEAFNLFRRLGDVVGRPTVLYVGTNDGILHAFAVEDHDVESVCGDIRERSTACTHIDYDATELIDAGEELWGFVPPMLLGKLQDALTGHQFFVDGTPVVQDVYYARVLGDAPLATEYHTVLVNALRGGGSGVFALEVTDPITEASGSAAGGHVFQPPKFLWQFTDPEMGDTYGTPAIAQVLVDESGTLVARAVAIIPGGRSASTGSPSAVLAGDMLPDEITGITPRTQRNDYGSTGRGLYIVDIATGRLIRKFGTSALSAPMTGAVAAFPADVGQVADRAFMTDADGVIWRLDMSDPDPAEWKLVAFHDIFHDQAALFKQPAYNAPVLSVNPQGDLVILQATGDVDILDGTEFNRVVSLTENLTFDTSGVVTAVAGTLNWEVDLDASEQVTGPLTLFDSKVYFGSFKSITSIDACEFGESRLWGVHYIDNDGGGGPADGIASTVGGAIDTTFVGPFTNQIIMGVSVQQQPTCVVGDVETDPYLGDRFQVREQGGGGFQLVAQVGGDGALATGASLAQITRTLPSPVPYTEILGYAGAVD